MLPTHIEGLPCEDVICVFGDECGRGCGSGPVVAAFVIWDLHYKPQTVEEEKLLAMIKDSKKLSEKQRDKLEPFIKEHALDYAFGIVDNNEIDRINILQATFKAMHMALDQLKHSFHHIVVDGHMFKQYKDTPHTCVVGGDNKLLQIAAASIICKCYRDQLMAELHDSDVTVHCYDWKKNKGYLTPKHIKAIKEHGITPYHRKSFIHI
jgi:ribonuclease HII